MRDTFTLLGAAGRRSPRAISRVLLLATALLLVLQAALVSVAQALTVSNTNPPFTLTSAAGFGDYQNSYAWSMAWLNGKLYVGTARNVSCVEHATVAFYYTPDLYLAALDPAVKCTPDPYDLDLRAEIWQYTPATTQWTRVFQSTNDIPNPRAPGKFVARDIGFRNMSVITEPNGTQALYAFGVTTREYIPGTAAPRILRSVDGINWTPMETNIDSLTAELGYAVVGFRAAEIYKGSLFVGASQSYAGDGLLLEAPLTGGPLVFKLAGPKSMLVYELQTFNNYLYVGTASLNAGYGVTKTDATGPAPYQFKTLFDKGAGRGKDMASVVAMHVFKGRLYTSAAGAVGGLIPNSELVRINPDDTWEVVAGNPRTTPDGIARAPISGFGDGFGNVFSAHFWRMEDYQDRLFLTTNDYSWALRVTFLDSLLRPEYGFDVLSTVTGHFWTRITQNGLGQLFDFGGRTLVATPAGLFLGTTNHVEGLRVWQGGNVTPTFVDAIEKLLFEPTSSGNLLVMSTSATKTTPTIPSVKPGIKYHVYRTDYRPNREVNAPNLPPDAWVPGKPQRIATTMLPFFRDTTADPSRRYTYFVVTENATGQLSTPSNDVSAPGLAPIATVSALSAKLQEFDAAGKFTSQFAKTKLTQDLAALSDAIAKRNQAGILTAVTILSMDTQGFAGSSLDTVNREDFAVMVEKLVTRAALTSIGLIPPDALQSAPR
jgi:hypothetical protein